jgi:hypothetical protein
MRVFSAQEILNAFITQTESTEDAGASTVSVGLRGGLYGYFRVTGPSDGQACVLIERYNGAVLVNDERIAKRKAKIGIVPIFKTTGKFK